MKRFLILFLLCCYALAQQSSTQQFVITQSGAQVNSPNSIRGTNLSVAIKVAGNPTGPSSFVVNIYGCFGSGISISGCTLLPNGIYSGSGNNTTTITPTISSSTTYDYFAATATWQGGIQPAVVIVFTISSGGSNPGQPLPTGVTYVTQTPSGNCSNGPIQITIPAGQVYSCQNGTWTAVGSSGSSPVSSSISFTVPSSSIFGINGSPVTGGNGTLNLTVSGTQGGLSYFCSNSTLCSSDVLGQYGFIFGGGAGNPPQTSTTLTTNASGALNLNPGIFSTDISPLLVQWSTNNSGTAFSGIKFIATNVQSAAGTVNYQFCGGSLGQNCVTIDPLGNISTPGTITAGFGSGNSGLISIRAGTVPSPSSGSWNIAVPTSITGSPLEIKPGAAASGLYRTNNSSGTMTDAITELSGDATTSGSNTVTNVGLNGTLLSGLPTGVLKNTTGTGVPSISTNNDFSTAAYCADSSGSGTAQTCNTTPSFTPISNQSCIIYTTTTPNAGASLTVNVNSLGAKPVAKWGATTTLVANDILANVRVPMCYDGTNWEAMVIGNNPVSGGVSISEYFSIAEGQNSALSGITQNATRVWPFYIPLSITSAGVCYQVNTVDNSADVYDVGIYNSSGTLLVHTGATAGTTLFSALGQKCVNWLSSNTLTAGNYAFAITSSAASPTAKIGGTPATATSALFATVNATGGTTSAGALNSNITFPSTSWGGSEAPNFSLH